MEDPAGHAALEELAARRRWARLLTERGDDRGGLLLLTCEPSSCAWDQLTGALDALPRSRQAALSAWLEGYLRSWPDALREVPERWTQALLDESACPAARLTRRLELRGPLHPEDLTRLLGSDALSRLGEVLLRGLGLGDEGAARLPELVGDLTQLRALSLLDDPLSEATATRLESWAEGAGIALSVERRPPPEPELVIDDPAHPATSTRERVVDRGDGIVIEYDPGFG